MANLPVKHSIVTNAASLPVTTKQGTLYFGANDGSISADFGNGIKRFGGESVTPINNLTSNDTNVPLSANMGKVLQDSKVNTTDIIDNLDSNDATKVLSAAQGKTLNTAISALQQSVTNLTNNAGSEWQMIS